MSALAYRLPQASLLGVNDACKYPLFHYRAVRGLDPMDLEGELVFCPITRHWGEVWRVCSVEVLTGGAFPFEFTLTMSSPKVTPCVTV